MRYASFAGNPEAKRLLSSCVDNGRFPHALLMEGLPGSGRRTLARLLAAAAVCSAPAGTEKPCGVCPACQKAAHGSHPDILETGGDGAARSFHIDTVRELRETAYVLPNEAARRVMILAGANAMTEQAQNALLKILEEPPAYLLFILTCESRAQMLPTIQSRSLCVSLSGVSEEAALPILRERLPDAEETTLRQGLAMFGGRIGQVMAAMEDDGFQKTRELSGKMAEALTAPCEWELMRLTGLLEKDKALADGTLAALSLIFRDALAARSGSGCRLSASQEAAERLSRTLSGPQLMALLSTAEELQRARLRNINHTLFLNLLCARLRGAAGRE